MLLRNSSELHSVPGKRVSTAGEETGVISFSYGQPGVGNQPITAAAIQQKLFGTSQTTESDTEKKALIL